MANSLEEPPRKLDFLIRPGDTGCPSLRSFVTYQKNLFTEEKPDYYETKPKLKSMLPLVQLGDNPVPDPPFVNLMTLEEFRLDTATFDAIVQLQTSVPPRKGTPQHVFDVKDFIVERTEDNSHPVMHDYARELLQQHVVRWDPRTRRVFGVIPIRDRRDARFQECDHCNVCSSCSGVHRVLIPEKLCVFHAVYLVTGTIMNNRECGVMDMWKKNYGKELVRVSYPPLLELKWMLDTLAFYQARPAYQADPGLLLRPWRDLGGQMIENPLQPDSRASTPITSVEALKDTTQDTSATATATETATETAATEASADAGEPHECEKMG